MKKILVAISDSFPFGAAYAARTRALCKLFQAAGYETEVICDYVSEGSETSEYGRIYSLASAAYSGAKKLLKLPGDYARKLDSLLSENRYDFIMARSMFDRFDCVLAVAHRHHVPLILESCEWYDVKGFSHGKLDIRYYQFQHCLKHTYNQVDGVIAISRLLENHYRSAGKKVIRIPGIHEVDKIPYRVHEEKRQGIKLLFAGNVFGGKEQLGVLFRALANTQDLGKKIVLNIYGSNKEEVISGLTEEEKASLKVMDESVIFHGKVPQSEMALICTQSDFGVFFRPNRRSSNAGFPTKLGEYLAAGTPVITNDTGDISLVLKNEENGFLLSEADADQIKQVIVKAVSLNERAYHEMRVAARHSAEIELNYQAYVDVTKEFLRSIACHE